MQPVIQFIIVSPKRAHEMSLNAELTHPMLCLLNSKPRILSIPYARLYILLRYGRRRVLPILVSTPISLPRSPLLVGIPTALGRWSPHPALLQRRRAGIDSDSLGSSAAPDAAAKDCQDCQEKETANASGNANDKGFIVMNPRSDFFACRRTLALTLETTTNFSQNNNLHEQILTLEHFPPPPQPVPSRKFCCML